jgi:hypothetical protein
MAAGKASVDNLKTNFKEKNSLKRVENNNFARKENCKDLLKVCPERGMYSLLGISKI